MPEPERSDGTDDPAPVSDDDGDTSVATGTRRTAGVLSGYGVGSAALGVLSLVAAVLIAVIWSKHQEHVDELTYRTDVMQAAADWTNVLINMNTDNVEASLERLRDGTAGRLNADFDATVEPYREVVRTLQSRTTGQIKSVAIESLHHDLDADPAASPPVEPPLPPAMAGRTDSVIVVATSVSENAGDTPQTVRWNLRLGVSDIDGTLLISRLESLR